MKQLSCRLLGSGRHIFVRRTAELGAKLSTVCEAALPFVLLSEPAPPHPPIIFSVALPACLLACLPRLLACTFFALSDSHSFQVLYNPSECNVA